ncbi:MAG: recombination-associated protein RdgC [Candidatus Marinimicrobia bacterium]|nr:recombination-associated protein RdgC [Candidatus Neomarinimicrobiota bacterium]
MAFERGPVSLRVFSMPRAVPDDVIGRLAAHKAPPIEQAGAEPVYGWVTGRHLLDTDINDRTAQYGGYLRLALREARRKVPPTLLRAEVALEEIAQRAAQDQAPLNRQQRADLRREVGERLLSRMPPQLRALAWVHRPDQALLFSDALSVRHSDLLTQRLLPIFDFAPLPLTPDTAAREYFQTSPMDWDPTSYSPEMPDADMELQAGRDFITWLWFVGETLGELALPKGAPVNILVEGPLHFAFEGRGAHSMVLRNGQPVQSAEAKTALMGGKKLRGCRLTLGDSSLMVGAQVNADEFTFSGLSLPKPEDLHDAQAVFMERMGQIERFTQWFYGLFGAFCRLRNDRDAWGATVRNLHAWTADRIAAR